MIKDRRIRITQSVWDKLTEAGKNMNLSPNKALVTLALRALETHEQVPIVETVEAPVAQVPEPEPNKVPSPHLPSNMAEIRRLQEELDNAREEYEGYKRGVLPEDWELEQTSDYVVDALARMKQADEQLKVLCPQMKEG